jgi:hypothetical protein
MKHKILSLALVLALALGVLGIMPAAAQTVPAYQTSFTTSITYQNVDTADATAVQIYFYPAPDSTTPIIIDRPTLPAGAGTSLFIGNLTNIATGFQGSAIMLADRRLVATLVQVPQSTTVKNRPLSNGFESGSPQILLATVLKNTFAASTIFSIQNTDTEANSITVDFYNTSATKVTTVTYDIAAGASYYIDAGALAALGSSFNGSAVITAERSDNSDGSVVATAMELSTNSTGASAFESVSGGSTTFYMPSALCNAFGGQNSAYAVQNTSLTTSTSVTVTYSNGKAETQSIGPGSKASFVACNAPTMPGGFSGSATVNSTVTDVVAIGKVYGTGLSTAFLGAPNGAPKLALPYVRWSQSQFNTGTNAGNRQRTYLAIQNVGSAPIAAGELTVKYYDKNGSLLATDTLATSTFPLAVGAKVNSNPYFNSSPTMAEFGYYSDGSFGGSAIVECTAPSCEVVAIARVQSFVPADNSYTGEDYNGIAVP